MTYLKAKLAGGGSIGAALAVLDSLFDDAKDLAAQLRIADVRSWLGGVSGEMAQVGMFDYLWPKLWPVLLAKSMGENGDAAKRARLLAQKALARCKHEAGKRNGKRRALLLRRADMIGSAL